MTRLNRRNFLQTGAGAVGLVGLSSALPAWARSSHGGTMARKGSDVLSGEHLTMTVADASFMTGKRRGPAVTVNGTIPGPLLRLKEGQKLTVDLVNHSHMGTSIHWHGLLVPFLMDGVPGVTMAAVEPGEPDGCAEDDSDGAALADSVGTPGTEALGSGLLMIGGSSAWPTHTSLSSGVHSPLP